MNELAIKQPLTFTAVLHVVQLAVIFAGGVWFFSDINRSAGERFAVINARLDQIDMALAKIDANIYTQKDAEKDLALVNKTLAESERRLDRLGDITRQVQQDISANSAKIEQLQGTTSGTGAR